MNLAGEIIYGIESDLAARIDEDFRSFVNAVPSIKVGDSFYFGFWPVKLISRGTDIEVLEYDFEYGDYRPGINRAAQLWMEQANVLLTQKLRWHSISTDKIVFSTETAFNAAAGDMVEGVREIPESDLSSGWFVYTDRDREEGLPFKPIPMHELLLGFNLSILRFLGLPPGWAFNVGRNGGSNIWKELYVGTD